VTGGLAWLLPMRLKRAGVLLDTLGIAHCADRTPDRMSGGEQQRAAIATALANQPKVLLAGEPTGGLDSSTCRVPAQALADSQSCRMMTCGPGSLEARAVE
jgi:predicted ABC-type transport system involved in lysophospholipase L1 biosynthesis ATPase subunit